MKQSHRGITWAHFDRSPTKYSGAIQLRFNSDGTFRLYHEPHGGKYYGLYKHIEQWNVSAKEIQELTRQLIIVLMEMTGDTWPQAWSGVDGSDKQDT